MTSPRLVTLGQPSIPRATTGQLATVFAGLAGGALMGARRGLPRPARTAATVAGLALLGAAASRPLAELLRRAGTRRRAMNVRVAFVIDQRVERVFSFCRDFENFPRFIGALQSVRDFGDGRSRWCASTAGGDIIEWSAVTTKYVPNRVIAWETIAGSPVHATGLLRFRSEEGRTCVEATLTYEVVTPGAMRDALASLLAPPAARQLELDVRKLATYLETVADGERSTSGA